MIMGSNTTNDTCGIDFFRSFSAEEIFCCKLPGPLALAITFRAFGAGNQQRSRRLGALICRYIIAYFSQLGSNDLENKPHPKLELTHLRAPSQVEYLACRGRVAVHAAIG
jgi:hypothetical protein